MISVTEKETFQEALRDHLRGAAIAPIHQKTYESRYVVMAEDSREAISVFRSLYRVGGPFSGPREIDQRTAARLCNEVLREGRISRELEEHLEGIKKWAP